MKDQCVLRAPAVSDKWKTKSAHDAKPRPHKYGPRNAHFGTFA